MRVESILTPPLSGFFFYTPVLTVGFARHLLFSHSQLISHYVTGQASKFGSRFASTCHRSVASINYSIFALWRGEA